MLKSIGLALASVGLALTVGLFGTTSCICLSFTNNGIHDSIPYLIPKLCHTALPMVLFSTHKNTRNHTDKDSRGLSTDGYVSHPLKLKKNGIPTIVVNMHSAVTTLRYTGSFP